MKDLPELTPSQLKNNYDVLLSLIEENITGERKDKLLKLYDDLAETMIFAPASSVKHYHLAFTGGYCLHIKNVVDASILVTKSFKQMGGGIDFSKEELIFSALNHDLGKVGDGDYPVYEPQESEWHKEKIGRMFQFNEDIPHMGVTDRSLFLLQSRGIVVSQNEWIAIKCSDGLYDEGNKTYLSNPHKQQQLRSNLVNIIHWADHMACRMEYDLWRRGELIEKYGDKNS